MVAKRGKMGKGGFRLHGTGMRYGSIRLIGEWKLLAVTAVP